MRHDARRRQWRRSRTKFWPRLATVSGPDGVPLPASGKLSDIVATDGKVFFSITVDAGEVKAWESVRAARRGGGARACRACSRS